MSPSRSGEFVDQRNHWAKKFEADQSSACIAGNPTMRGRVGAVLSREEKQSRRRYPRTSTISAFFESAEVELGKFIQAGRTIREYGGNNFAVGLLTNVVNVLLHHASSKGRFVSRWNYGNVARAIVGCFELTRKITAYRRCQSTRRIVWRS